MIYYRKCPIRALKSVKFDLNTIDEIDDLVTSRELADFSAAVRH